MEGNKLVKKRTSAWIIKIVGIMRISAWIIKIAGIMRITSLSRTRIRDRGPGFCCTTIFED